jgi:endonuclease/exonuclease/phosphatase (EEP) superfamily protein YafD
MTRTRVSPRTRGRRRAARARQRREWPIGAIAVAVVAVAGLGVLAGLLSNGRWPWVFATYLRWPQAIVAVIAAGVLLHLRWWRTGVLAVLVAAGLATSIVAPLTALETVTAPRSATVRIAVHNTGYTTGNVDAFARSIAEADADLVVLLESEDIAEQVDARLPDHRQLPTPGDTGPETAPPVVLARRDWPTSVVPLDGQRPAVVVEAEVAGMPVDVVAVHPLPPATRTWAVSHERSIAALVDQVLPRDGPFVLACDCNATPWSPSMRRLLDTGLRGPTALPTFWAPVFGIPLDHVLLSEGVAAVSRELGPFDGSDHRLIVTGITVPR